MPWFKRESLHERLAREGGLDRDADSGEAPPSELTPEQPFGAALAEPGLTGIARQRRFDAVVSAEAPEIEGNEVDFLALPDGSLVVEAEEGESSLDPLATAVEQALPAPYRAHAVRKSEQVWAVSAVRIEVAEFQADGEELELVQSRDDKTLTVDGQKAFGGIPELERLGERYGPSFVIRASRIDGSLWEIRGASL